MKNAEDEAFEDIERRQGGFQAKRKMAANKLQEQCQKHGECFGGECIYPPAQEPVREALKLALEALEAASRIMDATAHQRQDDAIAAIKEALAQPAQDSVAYVTGVSFGRFIVEPLNPAMVLPIGMALYSAPQGKT
jgi:hypothetical protein